MSWLLHINLRCICALLTIVAIGFSARAAAVGQTGPRFPLAYSSPPGKYGIVDATTKYRASAVRAGPSASAKLIGYLPGAAHLNVDLNHVKGAWIQIVPFGMPHSWSNPGPAWVKRSRLAMQADYRPFKGTWPLSYMRFTAENYNELWVFPPGNRCTEKFIQTELPQIEKAAYSKPKETSCQELWEVPGTHLVYANPNNDDHLDFWYEGKKRRIFVNTIFGVEAGFLIYGYRDGKVLMLETLYRGGYGCCVATPIAETPNLWKSPHISDPARDAGPMPN